MNAFLNREALSTENIVIDADEVIKALDALHPGTQRQKHTLFSKAYPGILRALSRNVPQKKILAELDRMGLKLHPTRFKAMMEAEAKALAERGDHVLCGQCGAVLSIVEDNAQAEEAE